MQLLINVLLVAGSRCFATVMNVAVQSMFT